jgi:hypothetical protein
MLHISSKYRPNIDREQKQFFLQTNAISFYPAMSQIIAFRSTEINILLSDIPHENKQSLTGEEIWSINRT